MPKTTFVNPVMPSTGVNTNLPNVNPVKNYHRQAIHNAMPNPNATKKTGK